MKKFLQKFHRISKFWQERQDLNPDPWKKTDSQKYTDVGEYGHCYVDGSVADPDLGSGAFLPPGSGMGKKSGSGFGMNNPDHIFERA